MPYCSVCGKHSLSLNYHKCSNVKIARVEKSYRREEREQEQDVEHEPTFEERLQEGFRGREA